MLLTDIALHGYILKKRGVFYMQTYIETTFKDYLEAHINNGSPSSYLSYVRNAFKKFSGESENIFAFIQEYTKDSQVLYCDYLISLINSDIRNPDSLNNKKTLKNYKSALAMLANFFDSGIYLSQGTKTFVKDITYVGEDIFKNFQFRLETQDRYYKDCCFPCRLFAKIFKKGTPYHARYSSAIKNMINNTKFYIDKKGSYITFKQLGLLVITPNDVEVWYENPNAIGNVYTEVFKNGKSQGFEKSAAGALRQLSLDHDRPLIDIVTHKIASLKELKKVSDALLVHKSTTGLDGSKLITDFHNNVYLSLGVDEKQLLNDIVAIYDDVQLIIMDKKYNSSKNSNSSRNKMPTISKTEKTIYEALNEQLDSCHVNRFAQDIESSCLGVAFEVNFTNAAETECAIDLWAKENNINLFVVEPNGATIRNNSKSISGPKFNSPLIAPTTEQIDEMSKPNTVLFFKNIHQIKNKDYRYYLMRLVNRDQCHGFVADDREPGNYKKLENILFPVATVSASDLSSEDYYKLFTVEAKDVFVSHVDVEKEIHR